MYHLMLINTLFEDALQAQSKNGGLVHTTNMSTIDLVTKQVILTLPLCSLKFLENIRVPFANVTDALVLTWNMKSVPQGIFPALAVNLIKSPKFDFY